MNKAKIDKDILNTILLIHKEIDYISNIMRPKFNRYCKEYIGIKKKHAEELRMYGKISYVKVDNPHNRNI